MFKIIETNELLARLIDAIAAVDRAKGLLYKLLIDVEKMNAVASAGRTGPKPS